MKTLHTIYTSFAKRTAIILTLLLTLGVTSAWGAEETATLNSTCFKSSVASYQETEGTIEDISGGEWKVKGYGMVKGTSVTLGKGNANYLQTPNFSGNISKIKVTCSGSYYLQITDNNGNVVCEQQKVSDSPSSLTYTVSGSYSQLKLFSKRFESTSNAATTITEVVVTYNATPTCEYSVIFDGNGNTGGSMDNQTFTCDVAQKLTANSFSRTGYTFADWNTQAKGSGDSYSNQQSVLNLAANGETITLFAQWTAKTSTISFDQNGGEGGQAATVTATYDQPMPTPITLPTRYGHTFGGYYDGEGGTGTQYYTAEGTSAKTWNKTSASATLYAKWTEKELTNYRTTCTEPCEQLGAATGLSVQTDYVENDETYVKFSWTPANNTKDHATKQVICIGKVGEEKKCTDLDGNQVWSGDLLSKLTPGEYEWTIQAIGDGETYCDGEVISGPNFTIEEPLTDNCRWVEIALEDITPEDEIVVTMGDDKTVYALGTEKITNSPKSQAITIASGMIDINQDFDYSKYTWSISAVTDGYTLQPYGTTDTYLYGLKSLISIGDNSTNNVFTIFTSPENGNKCFMYTIEYIPYYLGHGTEDGQAAWKRFESSNTLKSNTLKFYKKTCLPANKFWIDYELANVTCTNTPPPFAN